jgi:hypothetical protein
MRAWSLGDTKVATDIGDDVGDWTMSVFCFEVIFLILVMFEVFVEVFFEVSPESIYALFEFGVRHFGGVFLLQVTLKGIFNRTNAPARASVTLGAAVLERACGWSFDWLGEFLREGDGATDGAGYAIERYGEVLCWRWGPVLLRRKFTDRL